MPDYYFHYTSRQFAQGIKNDERIEARADGVIYLTLDVYEQGAQAMRRLAIEGKPVEVVALIPGDLIGQIALDPPVFPTSDAFGNFRDNGGGTQVRAAGPIPGARVRWLALSPP